MPYNNVVSRTDAAALIPEDVSQEIIQGVAEASAVMRLARRLPNMTTAQRRLPVLSLLPTAYFVDGDTGLKQTTEVNWANKYIDAEEIAVIVPISEAVLDDSAYDIWAEARPLLVEEIGRVFDAAVLHGTNAPASWPDDLQTAAAAAGHSTDLSTVEGGSAPNNTIYTAMLGEGGVVADVEEDGFMVNGYVAAMTLRAKLRGLLDSTGQPVFQRAPDGGRNVQGQTMFELDGEPMVFPKNGAVAAASVLAFAGDWSQLVYSIRQDITWKILDQAVIQDGAGNIVYNLAQQDMVALRAVFRVGWQVPNPVTKLAATESTRYPFSILVP